MTVTKPPAMNAHEREIIARETAKILIETKAVLFNAKEPFKFTSGWASPVYIDCRKLISFPRVRRSLIEFSRTVIEREIGYEKIQSVAGGATAGIPYAAWISDAMMLPMQYVRKKPKGFGRNAQIEGDLAEGARVLLVEDLTTDGKSKLAFVEAIRKAGATCDHTFSIFYYGIFKNALSDLAQSNVSLHYLATWWDVLKVAKDGAYFDDATLGEVAAFLHGPEAWSKAHGGAS
jgi:orotate phosphoribosyltransferase